jgi:P-type E1-E2 ATPase
VTVGGPGWLRTRGYELPAEPDGPSDGRAQVMVGIDGVLAGRLMMADHLRTDAGNLAPELREAGIRRVALVSGDKLAVTEAIGRQVGVDEVYADRDPEAKLVVVREMRESPETRPVVMVGDGVNDAPALALADIGIAMGVAGATVSSETADAVITVDRVDRVADAIRIGRRSLRIALQSVLGGMGLSLIAMGFAAAGYIPPVAGALLQEGIDVAVIINALRALRG